MKKIFISICMIVSIFMLTGCVNSDITFNIDKKEMQVLQHKF
ncbi:hypothetical protein Q5M85_16920 [Paraclostridium bifermentans]|nr:hypothetical protein [Paraclostridium bifermentans]